MGSESFTGSLGSVDPTDIKTLNDLFKLGVTAISFITAASALS
ncbi:hypothetical protein [Rhodococcus sp. IEGM 1379]|nr:hypothetical protein [Rhodococcus sp. IEGM 1379]MDI9916160.1 hypothetical protein [Rhodococcus sp. IEGM 1379]